MNYNEFEIVAAVVAAHPKHEIVGRTRFQKTIKLLQRLGLPTQYTFSMHFYGPYSEDLQSDVSLMELFGLVKQDERTAADGIPYYVFRAIQTEELPDISRFEEPIQKMAQAPHVVLELAATYDAFRERGAAPDEALRRLRLKKGAKCEKGREEEALALLKSLNLEKEPVAA